MPRFLLCVLLTVSTVGLFGCSDSSDTADDQAKSDNNSATEKRTIGYSALSLANPFFLVIADTMKAEAQENGFEVVVVSGDRDVNKQSNQIDDFIVQGVDAIVINPCDSRSIGPAIKRANEAGIPVFTNDIKYEGDEGKVVCHVATDNLQGGRLAGQAMVKHLGETGGEIAILHFPQVESCQMRVQGFKEVIDAHNAENDNGRIEIVSELDGGGDRDEGAKVALAAMESHPNIRAIFAINDPSALGARATLESIGKADQVAIIGFDGQVIGKQAIRDGKILCDPIQFPDRIGKTTIEQIVAYFNGDDVEAEILIPSELYYQEDALKDPALAD